ncbi:2-succinyl-5-enolpyruvyl-6-hydroxy-3-cyclohexene-1-carboxylic-acid synthase [Formosa sp. A9]|uniref:2-succinyl-5-enolpyruvyl-6-hydroxy-3- cyclohexene-1-carboxylic-acid synthase n=1 Tax=Formosa sp. A9 TaxID=3442641 RepID=UPI003EBF6D41
MIYSAIPLAQTVVQLCKAKNIKHIVISPGSRNAPLTIGFTHDSFFKSYSIVDERCAAFFALGIAQQLQEPVAVVCTSGSALLNYYPALAEAYYSNIPLVVLSADRPAHKVGIGDGQTINQPDVFKNHIFYSANLKLDNVTCPKLQNEIQEYNEAEITKALQIAKKVCGPVHINIPFDEPLYHTTDTLNVSPVNTQESETDELDSDSIKDCAEQWNAVKRKLILVGVNSPNVIEQRYLEILAKDDSVLVFTETTSNLHHEDFFPNIDKIITPLTATEFEALQPDILLTFGGLIVSKRIKAFLRNYQPKQHWHVGKHKANNTFFCLNKHVVSAPNQFFKAFTSHISPVKSEYKHYWNAVKASREKAHQIFLNKAPFSDLKVFDTVLKHIPQHSILQLSNSSTIRYNQLFNIDSTVQVFCNRGTSGIDGSTSTAIGAASVHEKISTLITGDLSFFYDSNALWNNYIPSNFRIIIINNEGGGIFRILPGHKNTPNFDYFFETKHHLSAKQLAEMYGFKYRKASNEKELQQALTPFYSNEGQPEILEIFTPSTSNDTVILEYFKALNFLNKNNNSIIFTT